MLSLVGCSASPQPEPAVTVTVTAPAPAPAPAPSTAPAAAAPSDAPLAPGKLLTTNQTTITVLKYDSSVRVGDGSRIQTVLVKSCVTALGDDNPDGIGFSWSPWTLVDPDSGRREPASDRWDHLGASYPDDGSDLHQPGECVKGVIQFDPSKTRAKYARYSNGDGDVAMWRL